MRTVRRGALVVGLLIALGFSVNTRPPVASADSLGSYPAIVNLTYGGAITSQTWVTVDRGGETVHTTYRDYTDNYDLIYSTNPAGGQAAWFRTTSQAFGVNKSIGIWTCLSDPATGYYGCSGQTRIVTGQACAGCASYRPDDGQIWDDLLHSPIRLSGTQWNGEPVGSQWFDLLRAMRSETTRPEKGIGGGGSPCHCPTFYYVEYINGVPYCKTALPPFNEFPC